MTYLEINVLEWEGLLWVSCRIALIKTLRRYIFLGYHFSFLYQAELIHFMGGGGCGETILKIVLPPFLKGVYSEKKSICYKGAFCFLFLSIPVFSRGLLCKTTGGHKILHYNNPNIAVEDFQVNLKSLISEVNNDRHGKTGLEVNNDRHGRTGSVFSIFLRIDQLCGTNKNIETVFG